MVQRLPLQKKRQPPVIFCLLWRLTGMRRRHWAYGDQVESTEKRKFTEIIEQHQGLIHKVCRLYCFSEEDRRDLFQEILLQLWKSHGSFRKEASSSTWIYRVALNTAISGLRRKGRRPAEEGLESTENLAAESSLAWVAEERLRQLQHAIATLSQVEKALLLLHLEEKTYDEISALFGMSPSLVGVKLHRIRRKLKERLNAIDERKG